MATTKEKGPAVADRGRPAGRRTNSGRAAVTDGPKLVALMKASGCGSLKLEIGRQCLVDFATVGQRATAEDVYEALAADKRVFPGVLAKVRLIIQTGHWEPPEPEQTRPDVEDLILAGLPIGIEYDGQDREVIRVEDDEDDNPRAMAVERRAHLESLPNRARVATVRPDTGGDVRVAVDPKMMAKHPAAASYLLKPLPEEGEGRFDADDLPPIEQAAHVPTDSPELSEPFKVTTEPPPGSHTNVVPDGQPSNPAAPGVVPPPGQPTAPASPPAAPQQQQQPKPGPTPAKPTSPPPPPPAKSK